MFKKNVGTVDRVLRVLVGIAMITAFVALPDAPWRWALLVVGIVGIVTGAMSSCPLYTLFGLRTCPLQKG
ncbi:DUF2892 domain-containing protein [Maritimibacter sp. 55A14]|uniref:YgaP family membrane protein n=1 Tax=Maritimibacter sp. 55A14 TaxID=2174844 RepID=UPI000D6071C6|nr:DUF2892 domain-containing protein [Maritimibacter sp. 55A14]PWE30444.1 DUF2892 domain-containing protein [Maritimibacter sp. 55A14]